MPVPTNLTASHVREAYLSLGGYVVTSFVPADDQKLQGLL